MPRLNRNFFNRNTVTVARELLGKYLVRTIGNKKITGRIVETEAYCGPEDKASHASRGRTPRTELMFGRPGYVYVYLIYGMYHCLNIVTEKKDYPAAVLIRAIEIINPKHEILNSKQNPKVQNPKSKKFLNFENSNLGFVSDLDVRYSNLKLSGPGKICRELKIDKKFNGQDLISNKNLWIEDRGGKTSKIKKGKRIGVDYAGKWKDKLWRFLLT